MQPEFVTVSSEMTAFAGVAGFLAVVAIFYYSFSRNARYENLIRQQRINKQQQSVEDLTSDSESLTIEE